MKQQSDSAMILWLAAQAQRKAGNYSSAIALYKRACEAYERCGDAMVCVVGLVCMDIAECLTLTGANALADEFFLRAESILRSQAPLLVEVQMLPSQVSEKRSLAS